MSRCALDCHVSPNAVPSGLLKKTFLKQVSVTHVKGQFTNVVHCQSGKERAFYWFYQFALCHITGFRFHLSFSSMQFHLLLGQL